MDAERKQAQDQQEQQPIQREQTLLAAFHKLKSNTPITQQQLHDRMPASVQRYIGTFLPGNNKLPIYFPKEVLPALLVVHNEPVHLSNEGTFITRTFTAEPEYRSLLELLELDEKRLKEFYTRSKPVPSIKPHIIGQTRFFITRMSAFGQHIDRSAHVGVPIKQSRMCTKLESQTMRDEDNFEDKGFTAHIYCDGDILFKLHWPYHKILLKNLTSEQLNYIISLYELHKTAPQPNRTIILDNHQIGIHHSLPQFIQYNLEDNYNLASINALRRKECCKASLYAALAALPIAATMYACSVSQ